MKLYNIYRAIIAGKRLFLVTKNNNKRICFGSSHKQVQAKFNTWKVYGI